MEMTKMDICKSYRESKNQAEQLQVLADLNGTTRERIIRILLDGGEKVRVTINRKRWVEVKKMSDKQYAASLRKKMGALEEKIEKLKEEYRELALVLEGIQEKDG